MIMEVPDLVERAEAFATWAHRGQRRKYTNEPYINHPRTVVGLVRLALDDPQAFAAAWLHDVVEDCAVPLCEIGHRFGQRVMQLVSDLSDVSGPWDGNRAVRKAIDRAHILDASAHAQVIKVADLIDNAQSIVERDHAFARVYIAEKRALLEGLRERFPSRIEMMAPLWGTAMQIVFRAEEMFRKENSNVDR